jgi:eukaryotic-like serine/threonine-protein kinase
MIGRFLGRYQLLEQLGEGGAGLVYRAEDPRLGRDVAIKVLNQRALGDQAASARFRQEARSLSRLLHPNIATLFDFDSQDGTDFLVLEFVPGETLAQTLRHGPLPEARARAIALEIADALELAHDEGIVHRDLKPGNIMLTPRGRAKVLDFGLARLLDAASAGASGDATSRTQLDETGAIVGTLPYMAPEQITGAPVDARTDIYALGAVVYEMLAGKPLFAVHELARIVYQIAHEPPRPLREAAQGTSFAMEGLVMRCLDKNAARRFPSVREVAAGLRSQAAAAVPHVVDMSSPPQPEQPASPIQRNRSSSGNRIASIAVLPLENRSGDPEQEFFVDGTTDALIASLAQIGALRVISRTSSMRYKSVRRSLPEIARELNVDGIVEGSVTRSGARVRITAQLVQASTDSTIWSRTYDSDIGDILSLQHEVARAIADGVRVRVTAEEEQRFLSRPPVNPSAHVAYLRGRYLWNRWDTQSVRSSINCFEEALSADPSYALAYAGLADAFNILGNTNALPPAEAYTRARDAAKRGLLLDDTVAELHASLAYVYRFCDWDWTGAEREFLRALQLNPGYATARSWYARFLSGLGRHEEAISEGLRALELDPLSLIIHTVVGDVLFYARRYADSLQYFRRSLEMDPSFGPGHTDLARSLDLLGRSDEGLAEFFAGVPHPDGRPQPSSGLATLLFRAGQRDAASAMIDEVLALSKQQFVSPYGVASFFAVAGETDRALDWLERAYQNRDGTLVWIKVHPRLDVLRQEQRFRQLLTMMHLDA